MTALRDRRPRAAGRPRLRAALVGSAGLLAGAVGGWVAGLLRVPRTPS